ncbi:hypothetical protein [Burkholderia phage BCSR129]|nr:hypothetical protein [Burkholderia phage BCSR129]
MAKAQNAVVAATVGGIAIASEVPEWLQKGNRGSENVEATDLILPRLGQIQALSPQIKKSDAAYIEGAEQGQLFNNLTNEVYGETIVFIPVIYRKEWVIFKDRKAGGGFFGAHPTEKEALEAIAQLPDADKLEAIESHNHIGYVITADGKRQQIVFTCTKSKIKASRKLNSLVTMAGVDRFAKAYEIKSFEDKNTAGDAYWNVDVKALGFLPELLYKEMSDQYEILKTLTIKVQHEDEAAVSEGSNRARRPNAVDEKEF